MTALFVVGGLATLVVLLAVDGGLQGRQALLPGVVAASVAVLVASWLPAPAGGQPWWITSLVPASAALVFLLVVAHFRRHGRSSSRRPR